jgi:hypothetical protein
MSSIKFKCIDDNGDSIFVIDSNSGIYSSNTNLSINTTTGSIVIDGGLSIAQTSNSSSYSQGGSLTIGGGGSFGKDLYVGGNMYSKNTFYLTSAQNSINSSTGAMVITGGLSIQSAANAISKTEGGALTIAGGASINKDLYIGGNLTVIGSQTSLVSHILNIGDNLIVVNSAPSSTKDGGVLVNRYQTENDIGAGDVVSDIATFSSTFISTGSSISIFNTTASSSNDIYNNYYIKITSGLGINQVRQIVSYTGSSRTAATSTPWTVVPQIGDSFSLFNRLYASLFYNETSDSFVLGYTANDPGASVVSVSDYSPLLASSLTLNSTINSTGLGTGTLSVLGGASISKTLFVGNSLNSSHNSNTIGNIFTTSGNVGIGNNSPNYTLDVNGFERVNGSLFVGHTSGNDNIALGIEGPNASGYRLGFVKKSGNAPAIAMSNNANISFQVANSQDITAVYSNTYTTLMVLTTQGNLGIGSNSPSEKLDVNGNINVNGNSKVFIQGGLNDGDARLNVRDFASNIISFYVSSTKIGGVTASSNDIRINTAPNTTQLCLSTNGNVGIGIGTPTGKLDVNGSLIATSSTIQNSVFTNISAGTILTTSISTGQLNASNSTITNLVSTSSSIGTLNLSTGLTTATLLATTSISTGLLNASNSTITNLVSTNSSIGTLNLSTGITTATLLATTSISTGLLNVSNSTITNLVSTNSSFGTLNLSTGITTATLLATTSISTGQLNASNSTITNLVSTNSSFGILNLSTGLTTATLLATTSISTGLLNATNSTITNLVSTNSSIGTLNLSTGITTATLLATNMSVTNQTVNNSIIAIGNSNTLGNIFTTGGNVGINTTSPGSKLDVNGSVRIIDLKIYNSTNASGIGSGGSLTVLGGASISRDVFIGGNLFVNGQNTSSISGITVIGNFTTNGGVYTISNISIGQTMSNTDYKIIGSLNTTSNNTNVYVVSFSNKSTSSFNANIIRLDALFADATDTNLVLAWQIIP